MLSYISYCLFIFIFLPGNAAESRIVSNIAPMPLVHESQPDRVELALQGEANEYWRIVICIM